MARTRLMSAILGSVSALAATQAFAQAELELIVLDTIVIYGDRTTTNLDESTASVAIVGAEELDRPTVDTYQDAFKQVANVRKGDFTESGFVIRGINSEGQTPGGLGAPLASFYIDGVQQTVEGTRRGARGVFDAEQFEFYRGPQSTLSGRSALAGAVYLRTKDPEFARSGKAELTYGSDSRKSVGLAFGDQMAPNLAYRVSGEYYSKDSDISYPDYEKYDRHDDLTRDEAYALRGKLLWLPTGDETTRVLLSYSHSRGNPDYDNVVGPNWSTGAPGYGSRRGDSYGSGLLPDIYRGAFPFVPLVNPGAPEMADLAAFEVVRETKVDSLGIEVTHELSDVLTMTAQTGYSRSVTENPSVNLGTAGEVYTRDGEFEQKLLTQEFRLNYDAGALRAVGGLYFGREDQDSFYDATLPNADQTDPNFLVAQRTQTTNSATITNTALFGEVEYEFSPQWRVIAGGRIDHIKQEQSSTLQVSNPYRPDIATVTGSSSNDFSDTVFIPKLGVKYDLGTDQSLALIYQEGYRPGGSGIYAADGSQYEYDAERAKNLELSWRGRFMEDRLKVAANVFYQKWDNQQIELWRVPGNSLTSYIANAGESKSYGAEVELAYAATDMLDITASLGLLQTEFEEFKVGNDDFTGLDFPGAPSSNLALGFEWGADTGWFASGLWRMQSSSLSRLETGVAKPVELSGYGTVDLAAGYAWDNAKVTAYATNLFDKEYFTYESGPGALATVGQRREVGLRLSTSF